MWRVEKQRSENLLLYINENDSLPKNICLRCCAKLHTVCEFIDTARKSQEILHSRSVLMNQMVMEESSQAQEIKTENVDSIQYFDRETTITQMEISIDPMLLLQSSEGADITPENDETADDGEEVSYLHGLGGENVTIKLIRKCDSDMTNDKPEATEEDADQTSYDDNLKPFACVVCRRSFLTELALKNHSWVHYNEDRHVKMYSCCLCRESFDYKSALLAHLKDHKSNVTCKICGRVFRTEENLSLHMESHSKPSTAFTCKICGRAYNTNSNLKTHSITHSNDRPYKCNLCKKSFKRNQDLKFHINQHTGARPYKCPYCDKCFASSGNCYSHRNRMHPGKEAPALPLVTTRKRRAQRAEAVVAPQVNGLPTAPLKTTVKGITKYKCQICGHGFMKKDNFTYHLFQHTGEKPFQCSLCSEKFVTRRGLTIHHDRSHPLQDRPLSLLSRNVLLS